MNNEQFRVSSALKDIIGKELITDEFVAVFELVKNSFDANATKVQIIFENQYDPKKSRIIIVDNGKGMDYSELKNKWLFVAYSAKKDGTELDDYRNKIKINRVFAGAKGIGRFSCDRLGKKLDLITIKDEPDAKIEKLIVNWEDFESDPKEEFIKISVNHLTLESIPYTIEHGTILEISKWRDVWDRKRILKLKSSLAKLVNPNQENDSQNFEIEIIAKGELDADSTETEEKDIVNGVIKNKLFETLEIKTTNISVEVSEDGMSITSILSDRGDMIYKIKEKNPYDSTLKNIKVFLFQLNRSAKMSFHRIMGMPSVRYGSVFMYKNGFRIYPFGEPGEDILLIDKRKAQGYNRFLGNRDLIGRIEINGENTELRETTSRDGGLVKTEAYHNLVDFFYEFVLKRLEKYVVEVIEWGDPKYDKKTKELIRDSLNPQDVKLKILDIVTSLTSSQKIIDIEYDRDILNIIESKQNKSINRILKNVSKVATESDDPKLLNEVKKIDKAIKSLQEDTDKAIQKADKAEVASKELTGKLEAQIKETLFVRSIVGVDTKDLLSIQHHINRNSQLISRFLQDLSNAINNKESDDVLSKLISKVDLKNKEISTLSQFVTKAKFNTITTRIKSDVIAFINEYLENVYQFYEHTNKDIKIRIDNIPNSTFVISFRPIELIIIVDNFISNSARANAPEIVFKWNYIDSRTINLHIIDNGDGIDNDIVNKIFDFRFTTTNGSGLGLYHNFDLIKKLNGKIQVNNKLAQGVEFIITFRGK